MSKRMVSAHTYPGATKQEVLRAVERARPYDVMVTDPLVLGTGPFDIRDLDHSLILKLTDSSKKGWMLFIERAGDQIVAREE